MKQRTPGLRGKPCETSCTLKGEEFSRIRTEAIIPSLLDFEIDSQTLENVVPS